MSEKTEKFLREFKKSGIESQDWPGIFRSIAERAHTPNNIDVAFICCEVDLRAIFVILDTYITAKLQSDKVVEGILKDIQNNTDRIATSLESGVVSTIKKPT
jgi:hypothetical protein